VPAARRRAGRGAVGAIEAYKTFLFGLLDLTDNIDASGAVVRPPRVIAHEGDDPYLVVAADKGTATFSDIANGVSGDYGFWLGDAFASGRSAGYDHKVMGITARGAWEAVKRTSGDGQGYPVRALHRRRRRGT
jgi:glutamate dehydrogenase